MLEMLRLFFALFAALSIVSIRTLITAHEFEASVNHHLRGLRAPEAKAAGVGVLTFAVFG